ncbi:MAG: helix-turn-helix domain-containing protein [Thermoleophilia bacterium]
MAGIEVKSRTPVQGRPAGVTAIVTGRPEIRDRLLAEIGGDAEVFPSLADVPRLRQASLVIIDLGSVLAEARDTPASGGALAGEGAYLWLAEDLGQVTSFGSLPAHSYVVDISKEVAGPVRERLADIGRASYARHITDVTFVASSRALSFTFADGCRYSVPLSVLAPADGSSVDEITLLLNGSAASILQSSGNRFDVPWDFVLHWADEDYEYHRARPDVFATREEMARHVAGRVRARRETRRLTQQQLADLTGIRRPNIARLERGVHAASLETLERLAAALETSVVELVAR